MLQLTMELRCPTTLATADVPMKIKCFKRQLRHTHTHTLCTLHTLHTMTIDKTEFILLANGAMRGHQLMYRDTLLL